MLQRYDKGLSLQAYCHYPFTRCRITSEGWVSFCCFMRPNPIKPEVSPYLGNVLDNTFDDIWFSSLAEEIRRTVLEGRLHEKCQCPGCPYVCLNKPYPIKKFSYNEYPIFLEIDLPNTHCNVGGLKPSVDSPACIMCERASPLFRPENNRLFEVLERIKHVVPNLEQLHIQGIAEPFFQTRENGFLLFDVMDTLDFDNHAHRVILSLTTNGTLLKESVRKRFLMRAPNSITTFSIDAGTPDTFKRIRILDCFDKVLENLYAFASERNRDKQYLQIHNNINTMNLDEVKLMVQIAHKAGINHLEFSPTDGFNHLILANKENCGKFAKAQAEIIEECKHLNVSHSFIRPLDLNLASNLVDLTI